MVAGFKNSACLGPTSGYNPPRLGRLPVLGQTKIQARMGLVMSKRRRKKQNQTPQKAKPILLYVITSHSGLIVIQCVLTGFLEHQNCMRVNGTGNTHPMGEHMESLPFIMR